MGFGYPPQYQPSTTKALGLIMGSWGDTLGDNQIISWAGLLPLTLKMGKHDSQD